jgi:membrane protein DedA with SNARE-associated domain
MINVDANAFEGILAYLGLFAAATITGIGIPGPGDGVLVVAAIAAAEGNLNLALVILVAFGGGVLGCAIGYRLGSLYGRQLFERPGPFLELRRRVLVNGEKLLTKYGRLASFVVPAIICGMKRIPLRTFVVFSTLSRLWWALFTAVAAYYLGEGFTEIIRRVTHAPVFMILVALAVLIVALRWLWFQRRPSASAASTSEP